MKKGLIALVVAFLLTGCAKEEPIVTNVCSGNVTIVSQGDQIHSITQKARYSFEELKITSSFVKHEENKQKLLENYKKHYAAITKGLDITLEVGENEVIFTITFDMTTADFNELAAAGIIASADMDYVSLESTMTHMNLTCTTE